jgi:hypothetical protein
MMNSDPYKATAAVEAEIARFLFEKKKEGRASIMLSTVKRHLQSYHAKIYGDAVLEAQELVFNLQNRGLLKMEYRGGEMNNKQYLIEWTASDLDSIAYLAST